MGGEGGEANKSSSVGLFRRAQWIHCTLMVSSVVASATASSDSMSRCCLMSVGFSRPPVSTSWKLSKRLIKWWLAWWDSRWTIAFGSGDVAMIRCCCDAIVGSVLLLVCSWWWLLWSPVKMWIIVSFDCVDTWWGLVAEAPPVVAGFSLFAASELKFSSSDVQFWRNSELELFVACFELANSLPFCILLNYFFIKILLV